ncbi:hypothetical protein H312_02724 [Anncaliia algerae PRA339]|uniref:ISXO2-like transposase domain-containing protein n=1 Tax=Anncaliia algerae PRA339 TaxID=1288291 RepID=A0A059EYP5_9MICR|nr:hypothetical protein H312_02724 [Anncaliia algerae PRA339]
MNLKTKSHRSRSPTNKIDAITIVECNQKITKIFASVIKDKKENTILPVTKEHVLSGLIVQTDGHASYKKLSKLGYNNGSVCHNKIEFVNKQTGIHTQFVKSFHICLKPENKKEKEFILLKDVIFC